MPRIIELALFLTPFLGFAAWRLLFPAPSPPLWLVAGLSGFMVLMLVALIWLWAADLGDAGLPYVPDELRNGRVVTHPGSPP